MNKALRITLVSISIFSAAILFYMATKYIRSFFDVTQIVQQKEKIILEERVKFLAKVGLDSSDLNHVDFYDAVMYQSEKFGDKKYVFKAIVNGDRVIFFREAVGHVSKGPEIGFRQIKEAEIGSNGRLSGVSYGSQGSLSVSEFKELILKERGRKRGGHHDPEAETGGLLHGRKSWLPQL